MKRMKTPQAHLRQENGEIIAFLPFSFAKDSEEITYNFQKNELICKGREIVKHPKFKSIAPFESWCRRYIAEHDI